MNRRRLCVGSTMVALVALLWTVRTQSQEPPNSNVKRTDSTPRTQSKDRKGYRLDPSNALADSTQARLTTRTILRFLEGVDAEPRDLTIEEVRQLSDSWAVNVLRKGTFPRDIVEIFAALKPHEKPGGRLMRSSFLVGEGGQISAAAADPETLDRTFRYVIAWKSDETGESEIFLSIPAGTRTGVNELIAWDPQKKGFNFYRRMDPDFWVWRGETSLASHPLAQRKGCFECHPFGAPLMKEMQRPWNNWHSEEAGISVEVVPQRLRPPDVPELKALFDSREQAQVLEGLIEGGIRRANTSRIELRNGKLTNVPHLFRQLIDSDNVNLASSRIKSLTAVPTTRIVVPKVFFYNEVAFASLGITVPPVPTSIPWPTYQALSVKYEFALAAGEFKQPGDTFFMFLIPEPAFETTDLLEQAVRAKLVTPRLALCLLLVDFPNPVFSPVRNGLLKHVAKLPEEASRSDLASLETALVQSILAEAAAKGPVAEMQLEGATAEQQFAYYWQLPAADLSTRATLHLNDYLRAAAAAATADAGLDGWARLSISRRREYQTTFPGLNQAEFPLLLPRANFPLTRFLRMRRDGTVEIGSVAVPPEFLTPLGV